MPRYARDTAIVAKLESTYASDSSPTGAANAMQASKPRITPLQANNVDRDLVRAWFGASEQLVGTRYAQCEFEVELAGSGTAGIAPAFGPLLRCCAMAETITAATRVDYTPITNGQESASLLWADSGVLHQLLGVRGNVRGSMLSGERPVLMFTLMGLLGTLSAGSISGVDYTSFKTPLVVTDSNTGDVVLGGTVAPTGAPAITGGTAYPSLGIDFDLGNNAQFIGLLGGESVDITQRALAGSIKLDLTAAQEISFFADVLAATLRAVSLQHGTVAGGKVLVHQPSVQLYEPSKEDFNGRRLIGYRTRGVPVAGNDEIRLTFF